MRGCCHLWRRGISQCRQHACRLDGCAAPHKQPLTPAAPPDLQMSLAAAAAAAAAAASARGAPSSRGAGRTTAGSRRGSSRAAGTRKALMVRGYAAQGVRVRGGGGHAIVALGPCSWRCLLQLLCRAGLRACCPVHGSMLPAMPAPSPRLTERQLDRAAFRLRRQPSHTFALPAPQGAPTLAATTAGSAGRRPTRRRPMISTPTLAASGTSAAAGGTSPPAGRRGGGWTGVTPGRGRRPPAAGTSLAAAAAGASRRRSRGRMPRRTAAARRARADSSAPRASAAAPAAPERRCKQGPVPPGELRAMCRRAGRHVKAGAEYRPGPPVPQAPAATGVVGAAAAAGRLLAGHHPSPQRLARQ